MQIKAADIDPGTGFHHYCFANIKDGKIAGYAVIGRACDGEVWSDPIERIWIERDILMEAIREWE